MTNSNIVGEPIKLYVKNQIDARQKVQASGLNTSRSQEEIVYLNARTSWVKLASSTSITGSRLESIPELKNSGFEYDELAKKYVLYNGTSQINKITDKKGIEKELDYQQTQAPNFTRDQIRNMASNELNQKYTSYQLSQRSGIGSDGAYGLGGNDFGIVPMPGIVDVSISSMEMGSLKRASLTIKAHNKTQFDIIDMLYLRLGYTIMLEWGDSHYIDSTDPDKPKISKMGTTLIEKHWFKWDGESDSNFYILEQIEKERKKYKGCYDAIFGHVVNFKWDFESDGSYTIKLDILSLGDVVESLKVNLPIYRNFGSDEDKDAYDNSIYANIIKYLFSKVRKFTRTTYSHQNYVKNGNNVDDIGNYTGIDGEYPKYETITIGGGFLGKTGGYYDVEHNYMGYTIPYPWIEQNGLYPNYPEYSNIQQDLPKEYEFGYHKANISDLDVERYPADWQGQDPYGEGKTNRTEDGLQADYDFRYDYLAPKDYIQMNFYPSIFNYFIRFGALLQVIQDLLLPYHSGNSGSPSIRINNRVDQNFMFFMPNVISSDPRICLVSNSQFRKTEKNGTFQSGLPFGEQKDVFPQLEPFEHKIDKNHNVGHIMNIYLNFNFIEGLLEQIDIKGDVYLMEFLRKICDGINISLGGVNQLIPKMDSETNTLSIYDRTPLGDIAKIYNDGEDQYPKKGIFNLYGFNKNNNTSNFVNNIGLTTSITPEYATMITIGAASQGSTVGENTTAFSKWNRGITDRFNTKVQTANPNTNIASNTEERDQQVYQSIKNQYMNAQWANNSPLSYLGLERIYPANDSVNHPDYKNPNYWDRVASGAIFAANLQNLTDATGLEFITYHADDGTKMDAQSPFRPYIILGDVIGTNRAAQIAMFQEIQKNITKKKTKKSSGGMGFLPFHLQLTTDGFSGLKIYNKITVQSKFLPSNYPEQLKFVVTDVKHELKNNKWTTHLDTIAQIDNPIATLPLINETTTIWPKPIIKDLKLSFDNKIESGLNTPYDDFVTNPQGINLPVTRMRIKQTQITNAGLIDGVVIIEDNKSTNGVNANKLRDAISSLSNVNEKGNELDSGGDIKERTAKMGESILTKLSTTFPNLKFRITAGNDFYHHNKKISGGRSAHTRGQSLDITVKNQSGKNASEEDLNKVIVELTKFIARNCFGNNNDSSNFGFLNEYGYGYQVYDSPWGTGNHLHLVADAKDGAMNYNLVAKRGLGKSTDLAGVLNFDGTQMTQKQLEEFYPGYEIY